jgi:dihydropteroate synthase-like protein
VIDLGCDPGETWSGIGPAVKELKGEGMRVSVDSFNPHEVELATAAGAELVLSVNSSNLVAARGRNCEVVAIPDTPAKLEGLDRTIESLTAWGTPFRIDAVLEPIGVGFAGSLARYLEVRRRYPQSEILMGVGNLTELTGVDSAGVNALLLGFCQELGIRSVLTTEVINWCRSAVRELDLARRLMHYACRMGVLPKHLEPGLLLLRDPKVPEFGLETLKEMAAAVRDRNFRLFAEGGVIHAFNGQMYVFGTDPFALFEEMNRRVAIDAAHAFYLGYEMAKAATALTLGKKYVQDEALRWGFLTVAEQSHRGTMPPDAED